MDYQLAKDVIDCLTGLYNIWFDCNIYIARIC